MKSNNVHLTHFKKRSIDDSTAAAGSCKQVQPTLVNTVLSSINKQYLCKYIVVPEYYSASPLHNMAEAGGRDCLHELEPIAKKYPPSSDNTA
ncbi:hypothetical protein E2C01_061664 [Portunus trituberculatus]|uniref:Uncharacterized protein n=1 Tax=Portunus trituberculatus TaxID=210409 RepID=A0A5B7HDV4_PORTR|nr:hypothetical protein [Portunus trituberculatus]